MSFSQYPPSLLAQYFPGVDIAAAAQEMDRLRNKVPDQDSVWTDEEWQELSGWRYHEAQRRGEIQASQPLAVNDDEEEPEELNEVLSTAHEGGSNNRQPSHPVQPASTPSDWTMDLSWGAPTGGGWGSPTPTGTWGSLNDVPLEGMGIVRVDIAPALPGRPNARFAVRFAGYCVATKDTPEWDQTDELVVDWPAGILDAASWPSGMGDWRLSLYSLPFRAREMYEELKRVFAFFSKAHPLEDAEWLQNRWDVIMEAIATHTAVPNYVPETTLQQVAICWRENLLGDAWDGPDFKLWD